MTYKRTKLYAVIRLIRTKEYVLITDEGYLFTTRPESSFAEMIQVDEGKLKHDRQRTN